MSVIKANGAGDQSTGFYNNVATQSLRFDRASSSYLIQQNSTATDAQKWTLSVWLKRATLGAEAGILGSSSTAEYVRFESDDTIRYRLYTSSAQRISMITNAVFRDTTNFFHFVCAVDLSNTTDNDKVIMYANGTRLTLGTNTTTTTDTYDSLMNDNSLYWNLGRYSNYYGGYMSDVHIIDGQQLTPSSFAETKNGVWIAKNYTGTYGNNGARLEFKGTGTSTSSGSVSTPTNIGDDSSGNNNHFDANNVSAHDSNMPDSPENNFATLLHLRSGEGASSQTFSEGSLQWTSSLYNYNSTGSSINIPTSGKWYWEVYVKTAGATTSHDFGLGIQGVANDSMSKSLPATATYGDSTNYITRNDFGSRIQKNLSNVYIGTSGSASTVNYVAGDIISVAFDADTGKVFWGKNNVFWDDDVSTDGNPSSGTNETLSLTTGVEYFFTLQQYSSTYVSVSNFGQDSSFAGNKTAQGNSDANGIGDFFYAVPTNYLALCSANLPELTISPAQSTQADDHFDTIIYDGSASNQTITTNFQADFLWFKERTTNGIQHQLFDSSRLHSSSSAKFGKKIETTSADAEADSTAIVSQSTNDITLLGGVSTTNDASSRKYVMWHWKANGGTLTTNDASATGVGTIDSQYQANTAAGFSIVTYTGTGSAGTIAHGLGVKPSHIAVKARSHGGTAFQNYHGTEGATKYSSWYASQASSASSDRWNNTEPTSTVFSVGTHVGVNNSSSYTYVAYVFAEIEGYSKINTYSGNGSTDGTFVYTGFRPTWVMVKRTDSSNNWVINDATRTPFNEITGSSSTLYADATGAESSYDTNVDFLSNGFKARTTGGHRNASGTYIYLAFAEQPFKFSNAR